MKDFTYEIYATDSDEKNVLINMTNDAHHKKSWFKTEQSARKSLQVELRRLPKFGYKINGWKLRHLTDIIDEC